MFLSYKKISAFLRLCMWTNTIIYSDKLDPWVGTIPNRVCKDEADWLWEAAMMSCLQRTQTHLYIFTWLNY